jgi:ligand-binding sensor domain-containing protein
MHRLKQVILGLSALLAYVSACAQDFSPNLQQLNHRGFTQLEGAPTNVYALAQTTDGVLWLGSPTGLTRFDSSSAIRSSQMTCCQPRISGR